MLAFLTKKINWRYGKNTPNIEADCKAILGDSIEKLKEVKKHGKRFSLLFTSPPYQSVVNYHADQWLRLWLLNESVITKNKYKKRFICKEDYKILLDGVFGNCAEMMAKKSVVFVRTDVREFTFNTTLEILRKHFPKHKLETIKESFVTKKNQTELFNNKSKKKEIDILLMN